MTPKDEPQMWEFVHPCVQRGRPELLQHVKRKENAQTKKKMAKEDTASVLSEMMALREAHQKLKQRFVFRLGPACSLERPPTTQRR